MAEVIGYFYVYEFLTFLYFWSFDILKEVHNNEKESKKEDIVDNIL